MEKATFGAGCFWGVEATFAGMPGVKSAISGYAGGHVENPTYPQVCADVTGHAEVVQVEFDPTIVTYEELLEAFFKMHNPTQVNRQGPDVGSQYRTVIFTHSPQQRAAAQAAIDRLNESGSYSEPIATQVQDAPTFWPAEEYHQKYLEKRGMKSCHF